MSSHAWATSTRLTCPRNDLSGLLQSLGQCLLSTCYVAGMETEMKYPACPSDGGFTHEKCGCLEGRMQRVLWEKRGGNPTWHREKGVQDLLPGTQPTLAES